MLERHEKWLRVMTFERHDKWLRVLTFERHEKWLWVLPFCAQQSVSVMSWARSGCAAEVSNTPQANLFLLFIGKEQTYRAVFWGGHNQSKKVFLLCISIDMIAKWSQQIEVLAHFLSVVYQYWHDNQMKPADRSIGTVFVFKPARPFLQFPFNCNLLHDLLMAGFCTLALQHTVKLFMAGFCTLALQHTKWSCSWQALVLSLAAHTMKLFMAGFCTSSLSACCTYTRTEQQRDFV